MSLVHASHLICEQCKEPIQDVKSSMIEWLSVGGWAQVLYLRLTHKDCCYYDKKRELLEEINALDHWLPLEDVEALLDIAFEFPWDDKDLAERSFIRYIANRNLHNEERGTKK